MKELVEGIWNMPKEQFMQFVFVILMWIGSAYVISAAIFFMYIRRKKKS